MKAYAIGFFKQNNKITGIRTILVEGLQCTYKNIPPTEYNKLNNMYKEGNELKTRNGIITRYPIYDASGRVDRKSIFIVYKDLQILALKEAHALA